MTIFIAAVPPECAYERLPAAI